jgi:Ca-activated chloride channel family protein
MTRTAARRQRPKFFCISLACAMHRKTNTSQESTMKSTPSPRPALFLVLLAAGCAGGDAEKKNSGAPGSGQAPGPNNPYGASTGTNPGTGGAAPAPTSPPGSFGNVGVSGAQDFAAFRRALDEGRIPTVDSIDATGFFGEHFTTLPAPTCGRAFCLHGMLSVSKDLARGGGLTLLQMGMNSAIDPATVKKPPLNLAVVLDHSGSMQAAGKMDYAKQGVQQLIDALGPEDVFSLIIFDNTIERLFGPAKVTDKEALKGRVAEVFPAGGTNIYDGLEAGFRAVLNTEGEAEQRRVIFLTDGLPTAGNTNPVAIRDMSVSYNKKYVGLTTIGLGSDVNIALLRGLAESGGGNFYYIDKPAAVREVFMEELSFFVAPIAYDVELTFTEVPGYSLKAVHGTALWTPSAGGGKVSVPSVFLVSRTTTAPGPNGGRRGGGSAILAELTTTGAPGSIAPAAPRNVGQLSLKYRIPGQRDFETQEATVSYAEPPIPTGASEIPDYYSAEAVEKNTLILNFYLAFREATQKAQTNPAAALELLTAFQSRMAMRLLGARDEKDEDLVDDMKIVARYIEVLKARTARP